MLAQTACRFARLRRFTDAGHGRDWVRGAEYSKTGDECVRSIFGGQPDILGIDAAIDL